MVQVRTPSIKCIVADIMRRIVLHVVRIIVPFVKYKKRPIYYESVLLLRRSQNRNRDFWSEVKREVKQDLTRGLECGPCMKYNVKRCLCQQW